MDEVRNWAKEQLKINKQRYKPDLDYKISNDKFKIWVMIHLYFIFLSIAVFGGMIIIVLITKANFYLNLLMIFFIILFVLYDSNKFKKELKRFLKEKENE